MLGWMSLVTGFEAQRHEDFVRNAEHQRLVQIALAGQEPADPFYYGALAAVGRQLSNWGEDLQERYGDVCDSISPVESSQSLSREQA